MVLAVAAIICNWHVIYTVDAADSTINGRIGPTLDSVIMATPLTGGDHVRKVAFSFGEATVIAQKATDRLASLMTGRRLIFRLDPGLFFFFFYIPHERWARRE